MSRIKEELQVVPRTAKAIVAVICAAAVVAGLVVISKLNQPEWRDDWVQAIVALIVLPSFLSIYVLLIGYVNGDARRRGMRHVLWTLLAIFIPNAIGIILYFVVRDPLMRQCPKCGATVGGKFAFCSSCGSALVQTCSACRQPLELAWSHCPSCGGELQPARPASFGPAATFLQG